MAPDASSAPQDKLDARLAKQWRSLSRRRKRISAERYIRSSVNTLLPLEWNQTGCLSETLVHCLTFLEELGYWSPHQALLDVYVSVPRAPEIVTFKGVLA